MTSTPGTSGGGRLVGLAWVDPTWHWLDYNPSTGGSALINTISGFTSISTAQAFDPATHRVFFVTSSNHLMAVDARTGNVVSNPLIDHQPALLQFDPGSGSLVGISFTGGVFRLSSYDPSTGVSTSLNTFPSIQGISGAAAFDPATHRMFFVASISIPAPATYYLYAVDTRTGEVMSNPVIAERPALLQFDPGNGSLVGISYSGGVFRLSSYDPSTGVSTLINTLPGVQSVSASVHAFDPATHRMFVVAANRLTAVDTRTGVVVSNPLIDPYPALLQFDPDWGS